jgi:hypothetical protein
MVYTTSYAFDLYFLLVEHVFGNLFLTWLGMCIMFFSIGMFARMSASTLTWFTIIFSVVFISGTWGDWAAFIMLGVSLVWFVFGVYRFLKVNPVFA